jgi:hypothetical protein
MLKHEAVTQSEALIAETQSEAPVLKHRTVIQSGVAEAETQSCYKA